MPRKNSFITATDQFCGAGGSTSGAKSAGVEVLMALNHWDLAIETHNTNHPDTDHDCTDVQACDPRRYPSTDILITSPECTNHSIAKGAKRRHRNQLDIFGQHGIKPEHERSRATMWDVPRFAEYHNYNIIIVENVVDARYWRLWNAWLHSMHLLGYEHECKYLNSMHFFPCPQSRDRMYVVFWKKGNKKPDLEYRPIAPCSHCGDREAYQWWKKPEKKWGKYKQQYLYRCSGCNEVVTPYYYCAFNVIDWTLPITRIGDRTKPLAKKTMQRIQYGLDKYSGQQMIVTTRYSSGIGCRVKPIHQEPFPTQPGDQSHFLLSCVQIGSAAYAPNSKSVELPLSVQTTRQDKYLVIPASAIVELRGTSKAKSIESGISTLTAGGVNHAILLRNNIAQSSGSVSEAIGTQTTDLQHSLLLSGHNPGWARSLDNPTGTFTTTTPQALLTTKSINSFLSYYYGSNNTSDMGSAVNTVTTKHRAALSTVEPKIEDCYYRCLKAHEVQRAMSFGDDYVVLGTAKEKVKQLGNAVTPPVMEWLVKQCVKSLQ